MVTFSTFQLNNYANDLVVTDEKIARLYNISGDNVFLLPRGEVAKSFACVERLCKWFLAKNLTKSGRVVAVGGGSLGDTVGFASSIYKRGVKVLHVPTTLLAMVDSAIGGKTAIDLEGVKNAVGTFFEGDTLVDVNFLSTLDKTQLTNGHGEILKYRMLCPEVDEACKSGDMQRVIEQCVKYKQQICAVDPLDKGERQKLNFGHTVAHAMELTLDIPHGLAVLNGIFYETELAFKLGLCDQTYRNKWQGEAQKLVNICPCLTKSMLELTVNDKKNDNDGVAFVLPNKFERVVLPLQRVIDLLVD